MREQTRQMPMNSREARALIRTKRNYGRLSKKREENPLGPIV